MAEDLNRDSLGLSPHLLQRDPVLFYQVADVARKFYSTKDNRVRARDWLPAVFKMVSQLGFLGIAVALFKSGFQIYAIITLLLLLISWSSSFLMIGEDNNFQEDFVKYAVQNGIDRGDAYEFIWDMNWDYVQSTDEWIKDAKEYDLGKL